MTSRVTLSTPQRLATTSLQHPRVRPLASPSSPHTPLNRSLSFYNAPHSPIRADDDALIVTFGCRTLQVGFAGENSPRAVLGFGAETQRRVGQWTGEQVRRRKEWSGKEEDEWKWWGSEYELYRIDCREFDSTLTEAKLQRALRTAMVDHVLPESKSRKIFLGVPPELPAPILERVIADLFAAVQAVSGMTVLPQAVMTTVASGLRTGMVLDIGWNEAIVTAVVDLREVSVLRSVRAGKMLSFEMKQLLDERLRQAGAEEGSKQGSRISFEDTEEILTRVGWCRIPGLQQEETLCAIPSLPSTGRSLEVPFSALAQPAENTLFSTHGHDDHDLPLPNLLFKALLDLPIDARRACMSRIIITGGVCKLPGIKTRVLQELESLISLRGWDKVKGLGSAKDKQARSAKLRPRVPLSSVTPNMQIPKEDPQEPPPPSVRALESDPISRRLRQMSIVDEKENEGGFIRSVNSVGAWAGASLMANLRVKGPEIEREKFVSHGLGSLGGDFAGWTARIINNNEASTSSQMP